MIATMNGQNREGLTKAFRKRFGNEVVVKLLKEQFNMLAYDFPTQEQADFIKVAEQKLMWLQPVDRPAWLAQFAKETVVK